MAETETDLPRFCKVFLSVTASESLAIPMSFMELLEDPLPQTANLQGTGGKTWTVSFTKIRRQAYFTAGWSKFAEDHDLKDGEFLTFIYDGSSTFEVSVYDVMGCKVTRAVGVPTIELSDSDSEPAEVEEEEEEEEEEEDHDDEEYNASTDVDDDSIFSENEETSQSIYMVDSEQETEADDAFVAGTSNMGVIAANPCFQTCLNPRIYELSIPAYVVKTHRLEFGETISYMDEKGVTEGKRVKQSGRVGFRGWARICRRNKIKEKDVVTCEIFHNNNLAHSIKIHINRA